MPATESESVSVSVSVRSGRLGATHQGQVRIWGPPQARGQGQLLLLQVVALLCALHGWVRGCVAACACVWFWWGVCEIGGGREIGKVGRVGSIGNVLVVLQFLTLWHILSFPRLVCVCGFGIWQNI